MHGRVDNDMPMSGNNGLQLYCDTVQHLRGYKGVFVCETDSECRLSATVVVVDAVEYGLYRVFLSHILAVCLILARQTFVGYVVSEILGLQYFAIDFHVVHAGICTSHGILDMRFDTAEADSQFRFLVFVAQFGVGGIFIRYTQPHDYGKQCGYGGGENIRMPFQYAGYLYADE